MRIIVCLLLIAVSGRAATIVASSTAYADLVTAEAACVAGDTLQIPAGMVKWTDGEILVINVAINIVGAGSSSTVLTNSGANRLITYSPATVRNVKWEGVAFHVADGTEQPIIVTTTPITSIWLESCTFLHGARSFYGQATTYGLIRNCTFLNCDVAVAIENVAAGDAVEGDAEWTAGYRLGTTNTMVIEDTWFKSTGGTMDEQFYGQTATRITARNCVFTSEAGSATAPVADGHGRWTSGGVRSTHVYELYRNKMTNYSGAFETMHLRGGLHMVWSNQIVQAAAISSVEAFRFRNEQYATHSTFERTWDQLQNCHWYHNSINGTVQEDWTSLTDGQNYNIDNASLNLVFCENEDAWVPTFLNATAWASGQSYVQTSGATKPTFRKHNGVLYCCISSHTSGASTEPGVGGSWATVWAVNDWHLYLRPPESGDPVFPYTPLTYPHPLVAGVGGGGSDTLYRNRGRATRISGVIP